MAYSFITGGQGNLGIPKKLQKTANMSQDMAVSLLRIAAVRRFERRDVVDGEKLSKAEWALLRTNGWELRRVYAMAHWASLRGYMRDGRQQGLGVLEAAECAAQALIIAD